MKALQISGLSYAYGRQPALSEINLEIDTGVIHGIVGPDSAGKTTLLRSISTLLPLQSGSLEVLGLSLPKMQKQVRKRIGYMPQRFSLYQDLSVQQNLKFFARLFGVNRTEFQARADELYQFSRLEQFSKRKAGDLSGGMKQKLALSCALIHTPELIVLDEPTFGVDPVSRMEFWQILNRLKERGISMVVSTAYMEEAEMCDEVSLLWEGRIMQSGKPKAVLQGWPRKLYRFTGTNLRQMRTFLDGQSEVLSTELFGNELHISTARELDNAVLSSWQHACPEMKSWELISPRMEDVFLSLMSDDPHH